MNTARIDLGCAAINGGSEILVAGGLEQDAVTSLKSVEIYNIESGQWRQAEDLPTGVRSFAVNNDGDIWGIGTRENQVYQYDGSVDAWRHLEHVQSPGHHSLTAWVMIDDQNKFGCKPV